MRRIPFIDPIDIRYRRFENVPKPVAQAVMFCLMDVSGSMSEHMKDLAKRFYMLLYVFLTRRYRQVEIVFIRHTDRAEEVDEQTFFHGPASGGTLVSSALEAMHEIVQSALSPGATGTSMPRRPPTATTPMPTASSPVSLLNDMILPVDAVLRLSGSRRSRRPARSKCPDLRCGRSIERLRADGAPLSMRKVIERSEIFPVFHDLFQRRQAKEKVRSMTDRLYEGADWDFTTLAAHPRCLRGDRRKGARPQRLSEPDRGHHRRTDAGRLLVRRHAAVSTSTGRSASNSPIRKRPIARA